MMNTLEQQHLAIRSSNLNMSFLLREESYKKKECEWFYTSRDQNYELSNIIQMPLMFNGIEYNSSECLYQASKYTADAECIPDETTVITNVRRHIISAKTAMGSKITQKCAVEAGLVRKDWMDSELQVTVHSMLWVLELKFTQHTKFRNVLMNTSMPVVERSRTDAFWGCIPTLPLKDKFVGKTY